MKINFNVTGAERKALVGAISQELNTPTRYLGMPTAAYEIGGYRIDKNGMLEGAGSVSEERNSALIKALNQHGFIGEVTDRGDAEVEEITADEPCYTDLAMTEEEELGLGRQRRDPWGEDGMQPSDIPDREEDYPDFDQHHSGQFANPAAPLTEAMLREVEASMPPEDQPSGEETLAIELPKDSFTDTSIANLEKLVGSKAALIKNALGVESLPIEITDNTLRFPWLASDASADEVSACAQFLSALCDMAKQLNRVTAKERPVDNEKYAFRCFLLRLGFIGNEYKAVRKTLLKRLPGNGSFKSGTRKSEGDETAASSRSDETITESAVETL